MALLSDARGRGREHSDDMTTSPTAGPPPTAQELLELGRDREALAAATADRPSTDGLEQLGVVVPVLAGLVESLTPEQLDRPTPCAAFTVAGVLEHMVQGASAFAPAFRGEASPEGAIPSAGPVRERWAAAMAELGAALGTAGSQERTVASPFGDVPGATFARYLAFDGLVHAWDLASATGRTVDVPDAIVEDIDAFARTLIAPEMRDGDAFAAEAPVPAGATPLERLVAFSGRTPQTPNRSTR